MDVLQRNVVNNLNLEHLLYEVFCHISTTDERVASLPGACLGLVGLLTLSVHGIRRLTLGDCAPSTSSSMSRPNLIPILCFTLVTGPKAALLHCEASNIEAQSCIGGGELSTALTGYPSPCK
jgi:hypothetical protein